MKRVTDVGKIRTLLSEIGTTCYLCGVPNLHYLFAVAENINQSSPDQVVILCKDCSARRRKRPVHVYVSQRFSQVAAEYARLAVLLGKLPTQFGEAAVDVVRVVPNTNASLEALLAADWDNPAAPVDVSSLDPADPRLDVGHADFDEVLYGQWLDG